MNTKTIFKTLAFAMTMPAMLLTTACSSEDDAIANPENNAKKGYTLPVTINVTRQDDGTRATYDATDKKLSFSEGDKLFIKGHESTMNAGDFAGTLVYDALTGQFSGTITTENEWTGAAEYLFSAAAFESIGQLSATLLPAGYDEIGFLTISGSGYSATLADLDYTKAVATDKATAIEQFSLEQAGKTEYDYNSSTQSGTFALTPQNAILNFTAVTGQWGKAPANSSVSLQAGETTISGSVAPVEGDYSRALANFAIAVAGSASPSSLTLTVDGTSVSLGSHILTAGKIYNQKCANINVMSPYIQDNEKWLVYGTGASSGWRLSVAGGATVTLSNVNLSDASIVCMGNNTIILADGTTNSVTDAGHIGGPAIIYMGGVGTTLTIKGTGTLNVTGGEGNPAIGPMGGSCGDITIANTVTLNATAGAGQSKAITTGTGGGTVTIGGVEYADGANSPFVYPAPAGPVTYTELNDGDVLHVGDIINPSEEVELNGSYFINSDYSPYTVVRADITPGEYSGDEPTVTEKEDGDYYVIKVSNEDYFPYLFNSEGKLLPVTSTSDGILVTYNGISWGYKSYTFSVHEP